MSAAPVRSPTLRPHRMKKDESFLGKLGGTLARKKKAKEGEFARAEGRKESPGALAFPFGAGSLEKLRQPKPRGPAPASGWPSTTSRHGLRTWARAREAASQRGRLHRRLRGDSTARSRAARLGFLLLL
uniref:Uncharacterized protein n=1 Tax=Accipiter nisus TaxID=211598 RepID=A0A8B9MW66_9AVES